MPYRSPDEVLAYAEGVYKLTRARKHLENRGAEKACIRLLESVIKKTEREFFNPTKSGLPIGALAAGSAQHSGRRTSTRTQSQQTTSRKR
jgi:hypothetical protein